MEEANRFLKHEYIAEFNGRFARPSREQGAAFIPAESGDLDLVFSLQHERSAGRETTRCSGLGCAYR